jgi:ATP-dependent Clp protease ATP-binding subunit ClpC
LLRFDMNEYVDGASAGRLVGTADEPEGLLTGAVRRQPFGVLLFDEIEKAAPEIFDLLLALLDEGRLTDSLGRVADFSNAVILLTSNLGARESRARLGFGVSDKPETADAVFVEAAEKFFRPEFFNRLDRIIPFRSLEPAQLEAIARQQIAGVFSRDGLRRRDCLLRVSPGAMARLVELGQDPQLGARALKRAIEREVAQPLAERLSGLSPGAPMVVSLGGARDQLVLKLQALTPIARSVYWPEACGHGTAAQVAGLVAGANAALDRIEADLEAHAPVGRIELGNLPPESARYFACREQLQKVDRLIHSVGRFRSAHRKSSVAARVSKPKPTKLVVRQLVSGNPKLGRLRDRVELQLALAEWEAGESVEVSDSPLLALCRELALLDAMVRQPWDDRPVVLVMEPLDERDTDFVFGLAQCYADFFNYVWGSSATFLFEQLGQPERAVRRIFGESRPSPIQALFLNGFNLRYVVSPGTSTLLVRRADGSIGVLLMHLHDASSQVEAEAVARNYLPEGGRVPNAEVEIDGPVLHMITENKTITDFRTGLVISAQPSQEEFRALVLSALPLPAEVGL